MRALGLVDHNQPCQDLVADDRLDSTTTSRQTLTVEPDVH